MHLRLTVYGEEVEWVKDFQFLRKHISEDLSWTINTTHIIKKAQKNNCFLRALKKNKLPPPLLRNFYHCIIEGVLVYGCTV